MAKRESKRAKATTCDFKGYVGYYLYGPATSSPKEAKKTGERTPQLERIRKRQIKNQLKAGESDDENGDPTFADPNHAAKKNEEMKTEAVKATTTIIPVEQREVELVAATTPPKPTLPQTSLQNLQAAYGAALHHNDETQFDGGIADNKMWQGY